MADSLAGSSPYKLWNFPTTGTVRCLNCHGNLGSVDPANPPLASGGLAPHASANRGILLANYRDRVLKSSTEAYRAADFALCYLCHAEAPFTNSTGTATNFRYHGLHVSGIRGEGSGGTDIDTTGAGQGNAICAECHFRIHSVSYSYGSQVVSGTRLVNFSPNVTPGGMGGGMGGGAGGWTQNGTTGGTCTLTCHGEQHHGYRY
jgi:hypothetical protein